MDASSTVSPVRKSPTLSRGTGARVCTGSTGTVVPVAVPGSWSSDSASVVSSVLSSDVASGVPAAPPPAPSSAPSSAPDFPPLDVPPPDFPSSGDVAEPDAPVPDFPPSDVPSPDDFFPLPGPAGSPVPSPASEAPWVDCVAPASGAASVLPGSPPEVATSQAPMIPARITAITTMADRLREIACMPSLPLPRSALSPHSGRWRRR